MAGHGVPAGLQLTADKTILTSVDGTEDAQLIVTVANKNGNAVKACPPVTLTLVSGPGEFPTGPSITFDPSSDIAIRDGQAAIEFRSYYAGESVIRATSPGLKDATIKIVSLGEPKFIAGKTASVKPRPYVPFTGQPVNYSVTRFGLNNPVRVSSAAPGHGGSLANDGIAATFWQAAERDTNAWWQVDLERIVTVSRINLMFQSEGNWRYRIEISDDGSNNWKPVADQTQTATSDRLRNDTAQPGARGRFLRVKITGLPTGRTAAVSEVEVWGTLD